MIVFTSDVCTRKIGQMEVYKTHHHGSDHSSNPTFMNKIKPRVAIVSAGDGNSYGPSTASAVRRVYKAGPANVYWTER